MNTGDPWPDLDEAELRVHEMQTKLHQWAISDPGRRFDDLYNLVYDPAFLVVAWSRVQGKQGGTLGRCRWSGSSLHRLRCCESCSAGCEMISRHAGSFPMPVRETMIPKANGKLRRLGIPTAADRVVQASLKLVLEPIFEADFKPCSYGFRPKRRAQDAIAEIHFLASPTRNYEWVFEGDITACFDEIDHAALMGRVRDRIGDKRVLGLVRAFLRAGILSEDAVHRDTITGTPQGGILSPLLANIALSVLDEHFTAKWEALGSEWKRSKHRHAGGAIIQVRPLRGRLCGHGVRQPGRCRGAARRGCSGARSDGPAPVGREDEGLPHRRGVRLLGVPHPARGSSGDRTERSGVHLPVEEVVGLGDGKGACAHPPVEASNAR